MINIKAVQSEINIQPHSRH